MLICQLISHFSMCFSVLSRSTAFNFNPKPAHPRILCHSLIELLNQISPAFRKSFSTLQKRRWAKTCCGGKSNGSPVSHGYTFRNSSLEPTWAALMGFFFFAVCNPECSSILMSGSRHLFRCSPGSPVRRSTRWTVSEPRRCSPATWALRSTQLARWQNVDSPSDISVIGRTGQHTETKIIDLHLHLCKPVEVVTTTLLSQVRDWNEELQGCRELARNTVQERLHRERSIFKVRELTDIKKRRMGDFFFFALSALKLSC